MKQKKNTQEDEEKKYKLKIIIMIIIIIIILLLLITSCTSQFWGRIGNMFTKEETIDIDDDTNDKKVIENKELTFDVDEVEVYLNEVDKKLTFSYKNISPKKFTCVVNDSEIATCSVKDGYVLIHPKRKGETTIILETVIGSKIYRATAKLVVKGSKGSIFLSSVSGIIDLSYDKTLEIPYSLIDLSGDVSVSISDSSIASVEVRDGMIVIVGKKKGKAIVTLTVKSGNKEYSETFTLTVTRSNIETVTKTTKKKNQKGKDSTSTLEHLSSSKGSLSFKEGVYDYYLAVPNSTSSLTLKVQPKSKKAKVTYKVNGKSVSSLYDIPLKEGDNKIEITVTAEDGTTTTYTVTVNRSKKVTSKENALKDLLVSKGTLTPKFKEDVLNYTVSVDSSVESIDITVKKKNQKEKVVYKYKGKTVTDLKDLPLSFGKNKVEIEVTSEDGKKRTYTVTIDRQKSRNNYLKDIEISDNLSLNETFKKNKTSYSVTVPYDKDKIELKGIVEDSKSKVTYKDKNGNIIDFKKYTLKPGDNQIDIVVTSEDGTEKTYTVTIYRKIRTIQLTTDNYQLLTTKKNKILYRVYDDNTKVDDYSQEEIEISWDIEYKGKITIEKGAITLIPDSSMQGKEGKITIQYKNGSKYTATVTFVENEYFADTYRDTYNVEITSENDGRDIVVENNLFQGEVTYKETETGIRIYEEGNEDVYLDVEFNKDEIEVESVTGSSSLGIKFKANKTGGLKLLFKGKAYEEEIEEFDVTLNATQKYILTLDSNGGVFDEFTTEEKITVKEGESFDLTSYFKGYKTDEDCKVYDFLSFNTKQDASGDNYDNDHSIIVVNSDITLYAIYSKEASEQEEVVEKTLYLTDVDLFYNEEYFKRYDEDKVIYPGANGSYIMTLNNNSSNDITITSITLEEDNICVDDGCLNMGYVIKDHQNKYYLKGETEEYKILNEENPQVIPIDVTVKKKEATEFSILWKWVEQNDTIDTLIGNKKGIYKLTVSIQFKTVDNKCNDGGKG